MDTQEAQKIIEQEKQTRAFECLKKIELILQEMNCKMQATVIIQDGSVSSQVQIVPL